MIRHLVAFDVSLVHDVEFEFTIPWDEYFDWLADVAGWTKDLIVVTILDGFTNFQNIWVLIRYTYGATGTIVFWKHEIEGVSNMKILKDLCNSWDILRTIYFVLFGLRLSKSVLMWVVHGGHRERVVTGDIQIDRYATIIIKSL